MTVRSSNQRPRTEWSSSQEACVGIIAYIDHAHHHPQSFQQRKLLCTPRPLPWLHDFPFGHHSVGKRFQDGRGRILSWRLMTKLKMRAGTTGVFVKFILSVVKDLLLSKLYCTHIALKRPHSREKTYSQDLVSPMTSHPTLYPRRSSFLSPSHSSARTCAIVLIILL